MTRQSLISAFGAAVATLAVVSAADPQTVPAAPLRQFKAAVHQYVELHRVVERQLRPLRKASDASDIVDHANAMASALQTARAQAREGDMFTPAVGALIRARISEALVARGFLPEEVIAASLEEADERAPAPVVNGRFPLKRGAAMWPCMIDALPRLPEELQYRIVGRDLLLIDVHADFVVDILRDAVR